MRQNMPVTKQEKTFSKDEKTHYDDGFKRPNTPLQ